MKRAVLFMAILTVMSLSLYPVQARYGNFKGTRGQGMMKGNPILHMQWERFQELGTEIGLSETQMDQIYDLRQSFRSDTTPLKAQNQELHAQLRDLIQRADQDSKADAHKLAKSITDVQYQLMIKGIDANFEIQKILTPEQHDQLRAKMKENMKERRRDRQDRRQKKGYGRRQGQRNNTNDYDEMEY